MGINRDKIPYYFWFIQHKFWVCFLVIVLFCFLFLLCIQILLDSYFTHVMFLFLFVLFHNLNLEIVLPMFSFWFKKSYKFGHLHAYDKIHGKWCPTNFKKLSCIIIVTLFDLWIYRYRRNGIYCGCILTFKPYYYYTS